MHSCTHLSVFHTSTHAPIFSKILKYTYIRVPIHGINIYTLRSLYHSLHTYTSAPKTCLLFFPFASTPFLAHPFFFTFFFSSLSTKERVSGSEVPRKGNYYLYQRKRRRDSEPQTASEKGVRDDMGVRMRERRQNGVPRESIGRGMKITRAKFENIFAFYKIFSCFQTFFSLALSILYRCINILLSVFAYLHVYFRISRMEIYHLWQILFSFLVKSDEIDCLVQRCQGERKSVKCSKRFFISLP